MFSKKSLLAITLTATLLLAPATLAAPSSSHAGFGWMDYVSSVFDQIVEFFSIDRESPRTEQQSIAKPNVSSVCEIGSMAEPNGCP